MNRLKAFLLVFMVCFAIPVSLFTLNPIPIAVAQNIDQAQQIQTRFSSFFEDYESYGHNTRPDPPWNTIDDHPDSVYLEVRHPPGGGGAQGTDQMLEWSCLAGSTSTAQSDIMPFGGGNLTSGRIIYYLRQDLTLGYNYTGNQILLGLQVYDSLTGNTSFFVGFSGNDNISIYDTGLGFATPIAWYYGDYYHKILIDFDCATQKYRIWATVLLSTIGGVVIDFDHYLGEFNFYQYCPSIDGFTVLNVVAPHCATNMWIDEITVYAEMGDLSENMCLPWQHSTTAYGRYFYTFYTNGSRYLLTLMNYSSTLVHSEYAGIEIYSSPTAVTQRGSWYSIKHDEYDLSYVRVFNNATGGAVYSRRGYLNVTGRDYSLGPPYPVPIDWYTAEQTVIPYTVGMFFSSPVIEIDSQKHEYIGFIMNGNPWVVKNSRAPIDADVDQWDPVLGWTTYGWVTAAGYPLQLATLGNSRMIALCSLKASDIMAVYDQAATTYTGKLKSRYYYGQYLLWENQMDVSSKNLFYRGHPLVSLTQVNHTAYVGFTTNASCVYQTSVASKQIQKTWNETTGVLNGSDSAFCLTADYTQVILSYMNFTTDWVLTRIYTVATNSWADGLTIMGLAWSLASSSNGLNAFYETRYGTFGVLFPDEYLDGLVLLTDNAFIGDRTEYTLDIEPRYSLSIGFDGSNYYNSRTSTHDWLRDNATLPDSRTLVTFNGSEIPHGIDIGRIKYQRDIADTVGTFDNGRLTLFKYPNLLNNIDTQVAPILYFAANGSYWQIFYGLADTSAYVTTGINWATAINKIYWWQMLENGWDLPFALQRGDTCWTLYDASWEGDGVMLPVWDPFGHVWVNNIFFRNATDIVRDMINARNNVKSLTFGETLTRWDSASRDFVQEYSVHAVDSDPAALTIMDIHYYHMGSGGITGPVGHSTLFFEITDMEGCGSWLFCEEKWYTFKESIFTATPQLIKNVTIAFSDGWHWANSTYDHVTKATWQVGESSDYIDARVAQEVETAGVSLVVYRKVHLKITLLDVLGVDVYMRVSYTDGSADPWVLVGSDYFNIYSLGGLGELDVFGSGGRTIGGDIFEIWAGGVYTPADILDDNFEHGEISPSWNIYAVNGSTAVVDRDFPNTVTTSKYDLHLTSVASAPNVWASQQFKNITSDIVHAQVFFASSSNSCEWSVWITDGSLPALSHVNAAFLHNLSICVWDSVAMGYHSVGAYVPWQTYNVTWLINVTSGDYDMYIDGGLSFTGNIDAGFGVHRLGIIALVSGTGDAGSSYWDDIKLWKNWAGGTEGETVASTIYRRLQQVHALFAFASSTEAVTQTVTLGPFGLILGTTAPHFNEGYVEFGINVCRSNDIGFFEQWRVRLNITGGHISDLENWIKVNVTWFDRNVKVKSDNLYSFWEGVRDENQLSRFYLDLWFNKVNGSTVIGGRVNAVTYGVSDRASWWYRFFSGHEWGAMKEKVTQSMFFVDLKDPVTNLVYPSKDIKLMKFWARVYRTGDYSFNYTLKDYDLLEFKYINNGPMEGINTPILVPTQMPTMPAGGFLNILLSSFLRVGDLFVRALLAGAPLFIGAIDNGLFYITGRRGMFSSAVGVMMTAFTIVWGWVLITASAIPYMATFVVQFVLFVTTLIVYVLQAVVWFTTNTLSLIGFPILFIIALFTGTTFTLPFTTIVADFSSVQGIVGLPIIFLTNGGFILIFLIKYLIDDGMSGIPGRVVNLFVMARMLFENLFYIFQWMWQQFRQVYGFVKSHLPFLSGGV